MYHKKGVDFFDSFFVIRVLTFPLNPPLSKGDLSLRSEPLCNVVDKWGFGGTDPAKF